MSTTDPDLLVDNPANHPHWIDSACFYLSVPESRLHGFIFYFFRPNLNMLTAGPDGLRILNFRASADVSVYFKNDR